MTIVRSSVAALSLASALVACVKTEQKPADSTAVSPAPVAGSTTTTTTSTTQTSPPIQPPGGVATPSDVWVVTEHGIGKLSAGMTVAEAKAAVPGFSVPASRDSMACTYGNASSLPAGVFVMVEGGKIARVEVRRGAVATSAGAKVGDSEDRIKSLYPSATVTPHKYLPAGHYLNYAPSGSNDKIVFETDGKRVTTYRAGTKPQIDYVEGCG